jgi:hypothetical protein
MREEALCVNWRQSLGDSIGRYHGLTCLGSNTVERATFGKNFRAFGILTRETFSVDCGGRENARLNRDSRRTPSRSYTCEHGSRERATY